MNLNNLPEWLKYLESFPSGLLNKSLQHVRIVAQKLDVLSFSSKVITVAGTNGKGSCIVFLEAILLAAGLRVGAYISPHLLYYNERVRLNGKDIDDQSLCAAFALVEQARVSVGVSLSYFEFSTLAALLIYKKYNPDFLLLEVGIGGRFDAVNIVDSDLAVITTISFDHTEILGKTRNAIGYEKSGIMRSYKPVICGANMPESVYTAAANIQAQPYFLNQDFVYWERDDHWCWQFLAATAATTDVIENLPLPRLPLPSAALALMAIKLLSSDFKITIAAIIAGLKQAFLLGRLQKIMVAGKEIICDVAHNYESAALLAANLTKSHCRADGNILAVVSALQDKDITAIFQPLENLVTRWYLGVLDNVRAANARQLAAGLQNIGITSFVSLTTVAAALKQAIAECQEKDKIVVFGSFYTVAECLKIITSY